MTPEEAIAKQAQTILNILKLLGDLNRARMELERKATTNEILLDELVRFLAPEKVEAWRARSAVIEREARQKYLEIVESRDPGLAAQLDDRDESETKDLDG